MGSTTPPLEYLMNYSQTGLQDFELSRLAQLAILRKEFGQVFEELVEAEASARLARLMLEFRRAQTDAHSVEPKWHLVSELEKPKLLDSCDKRPILRTALRLSAGRQAPVGALREQSKLKTLKGRDNFHRQPCTSLALEHGSRFQVLKVSGNANADLRRMERSLDYMRQSPD